MCGTSGYKMLSKHNKSAGLLTSADKSMIAQRNSPAQGEKANYLLAATDHHYATRAAAGWAQASMTSRPGNGRS